MFLGLRFKASVLSHIAEYVCGRANCSRPLLAGANGNARFWNAPYAALRASPLAPCPRSLLRVAQSNPEQTERRPPWRRRWAKWRLVARREGINTKVRVRWRHLTAANNSVAATAAPRCNAEARSGPRDGSHCGASDALLRRANFTSPPCPRWSRHVVVESGASGALRVLLVLSAAQSREQPWRAGTCPTY